MKTQTYIYKLLGDVWVDHSSPEIRCNYEITILMPTKYETVKAAKTNKSSARFEKHEGHIVLVIYSDWKQGINESGEWYEHVEGVILDMIHWEESEKYDMPCKTNWDELFEVDKREDNWYCTVESLAYSISPYIER